MSIEVRRKTEYLDGEEIYNKIHIIHNWGSLMFSSSNIHLSDDEAIELIKLLTEKLKKEQTWKLVLKEETNSK